jgi:hypothetical protein
MALLLQQEEALRPRDPLPFVVCHRFRASMYQGELPAIGKGLGHVRSTQLKPVFEIKPVISGQM